MTRRAVFRCCPRPICACGAGRGVGQVTAASMRAALRHGCLRRGPPPAGRSGRAPEPAAEHAPRERSMERCGITKCGTTDWAYVPCSFPTGCDNDAGRTLSAHGPIARTCGSRFMPIAVEQLTADERAVYGTVSEGRQRVSSTCRLRCGAWLGGGRRRMPPFWLSKRRVPARRTRV